MQISLTVAPFNYIYSIHPFLKVTHHHFDRLYFFYPVFVVRYPWKACLFAFRLMPYLLGLFHRGVCRVSKYGTM